MHFGCTIRKSQHFSHVSLVRACENHGKLTKSEMDKQRTPTKEVQVLTEGIQNQKSEAALLALCRVLYDEGGFEALTYKSMQNLNAGLYMKLYQRGLTKAKLIERLGLTAEYLQHEATRVKVYAGSERVPWTWDRVVAVAADLVVKHGHLPAAPWFQRHKLGAIVHYVYRSGRTWDQLQEAVGTLSSGRFVESRNGLRWLSHAEASLSNFLYARGIEHKKGERYPASFSGFGDAKYGIYDLHFRGKDGAWVDVEVWGDNPKGQQPEKYAMRRKHKEHFNSGNTHFLGIAHQACYDDDQLTSLLAAHIGLISPFRFDRPIDQVIPSTHWSNADELLTYCRQIAADAPGGTFPTEDWLRKRGRWSDRSGVAYNTLSVYVKQWLGGVRNVRRLLNQESRSTLQWDADTALREYMRFFNQHGCTPGQVTGDAYGKNQRLKLSPEMLADAVRIASAVDKYVGGAIEAQRRLGIKSSRQYWTPELAKEAFREFCVLHGITPSQAAGRWTEKSPNALPEDVSKYAVRLTNAFRKHVGKIPRGATVEDFVTNEKKNERPM